MNALFGGLPKLTHHHLREAANFFGLLRACSLRGFPARQTSVLLMSIVSTACAPETQPRADAPANNTEAEAECRQLDCIGDQQFVLIPNREWRETPGATPRSTQTQLSEAEYAGAATTLYAYKLWISSDANDMSIALDLVAPHGSRDVSHSDSAWYELLPESGLLGGGRLVIRARPTGLQAEIDRYESDGVSSRITRSELAPLYSHLDPID